MQSCLDWRDEKGEVALLLGKRVEKVDNSRERHGRVGECTVYCLGSGGRNDGGPWVIYWSYHQLCGGESLVTMYSILLYMKTRLSTCERFYKTKNTLVRTIKFCCCFVYT